MRKSAITCALAIASGCFYVDPINGRPSAEIVRISQGPVQRGGAPVEVAAAWSDPNSDPVTFAWTVSACAADGVTCDAPFLTGTQRSLVIDVPIDRADGVSPVVKLSITLEVTDSHGAIAKPSGLLVLDVQDSPPAVALQYDGRTWDGGLPVTLPITVRAQKSDPDDSPSGVTLTWGQPYAAGSDPSKVTWTMLPADPSHPEVEQRTFTPDVAGAWDVHVTATDSLGATSMADLAIAIATDQPPCIGETDPALGGGTIVVDQARRFSVLTVDDDIDVWPAPPLGSVLGTAGFHWSLASPATGGALEALGTADNDVVIDPSQYAPGDQLDLRVEISDAVARPSPCDPSQPTCSIADDACIQRQTWHLEIAQ